MLFEYIEHVRSQPTHARKRFAFLFSSGATVCIILVWLTVLFAGPDLGSSENSASSMVTDPTQTTAPVGLVAHFMNTVRGAVDTGEMFSDPEVPSTQTPPESDARFKNAFSSSPSTTEHDAPKEVATSSVPVETPPQAPKEVEDAGFVEGVLGEVRM